MKNSREQILNKLRQNPNPFPDVQEVKDYLPMVNMEKTDPDSLLKHFREEAEKLSSKVTICNNVAEVEEAIFKVIDKEQIVDCWSEDNLPLKNLHLSLEKKSIKIVRDSNIRIGITGGDAAFASTGSIVLSSGKGRQRSASLLPEIHIAIIKKEQICADFESWLKQKRKNGIDDFIAPSNIIIISGPSRTADISMELVLGMHGPKELHIIVF